MPPDLAHSACQDVERAQLRISAVSPTTGPSSAATVPLEVILQAITLMSPPKGRSSTSTVSMVSPCSAARTMPVAFSRTLVLSE